MKQAPPSDTRVTLRLALDPYHWRANDRGTWATDLAAIADSAAPNFLRVEGYDIGDVVITMRLWSPEPAKSLKKVLRDHEAIRRLRTRLADLGARPDFEIEEDEAA
ncbi:MAG: hypothetical protein AB7J28_11160 [Hyphomonadaceae bacterium]